MSLLVVGSVALDTVETPHGGRHDELLGGSAVHFSCAASLFGGVNLVGVVGADWPAEHTELLQSRGVNTAGLQVVPGGKTFRWSGRYEPNMNDRETLEVHLNVFGDFDPVVPESFRDAEFVFLANGVPSVQAKVLDQATNARFVVADTMDLWIQTEHDGLSALLKRLDGLVLNDSEARLLTDEENLVTAGRAVLNMGPRFVVIKKGEHGAMFFSEEATYVLPAYPTADVIDPTGAGDSFAGGMMGFLAAHRKLDSPSMKLALAYGTLAASFNVEAFGLHRMKSISRRDIEQRLEEYKSMLML